MSKSLKRGLISIGIALIISAPISRGAMISQNQYHPIKFEKIEKVYAQETKGKEILIRAEQERMELLDNPFVVECDYGTLCNSYKVLNDYGVDVPADIREYCEAAQDEFNVCAELLEAIAWRESRFDNRAENRGCSGLMQISIKWHKDRMEKLGVTDIYDAQSNIRVGADYLAELFEKYDGDVYQVLMAYNGDSSKGVSTYALVITEISEALERIHGK